MYNVKFFRTCLVADHTKNELMVLLPPSHWKLADTTDIWQSLVHCGYKDVVMHPLRACIPISWRILNPYLVHVHVALISMTNNPNSPIGPCMLHLSNFLPLLVIGQRRQMELEPIFAYGLSSLPYRLSMNIVTFEKESSQDMLTASVFSRPCPQMQQWL